MIASNVHDENSPSRLDQRENCPGSAVAEAGLPDVENASGAAGKTFHAHLQRMALLSEITPNDWTGVDAEDVEGISDCLAAIAKARERLGKDARLLIEHRVDLSDVGIPKGGTVDVALVVPGGSAEVIDHKRGVRYVPSPKWNRQIQAYCYAIAQMFACTDVRGTIVQPNAFHEKYEYRYHDFTIEDLKAHAVEIATIVANTKDPHAPKRTGEHCLWCRAKNQCSARAVVAADAIAIQSPVETFRSLTPEQRSLQFTRLELGLKVLKDALETIKTAAIAGGIEIPGWVVGEGRKGAREWSDENAAKVALLRLAEERGYEREKFIITSVATPAVVEKILGKASKEMASLAKLVTQAPAKPALVRDGAA